MKKSHHDKLYTSIEKLRQEKYSTVSEQVVKQIIEIQINNQEDRTEAHRLIKNLLNHHCYGEE